MILNRRTVLAAALGSFVASGCARGTLTSPAPAGVVTLNTDNATWKTGYDAASRVLTERIGLGFATRSIPNTSNYQQVVRMSARTDSTTDVVKWWNGYRLADLARSGLLVPLNEVWVRAEQQGWVLPEARRNFTVDSDAYGFPLYKSYYVGFYSRKAFDKIGARPPTSFTELLELCGELRDAGIVPIGAGGASTWESLIWFQQLVGSTRPDFYEALTAGQASYTDPAVQQAMQQWAQMYTAGLFSPPDFDFSTAPGLMRDGELGMTLAATWSANSFKEASVGSEDVGVFQLPPVAKEAGSVMFAESGTIAVPINAHKRDDAIALLSEWLANDVQQVWVDFLGDASANPQVIPQSSVIRDFAQEVATAKPRELLRYWESSPPILIEGNVQDLSAFLVNPTPESAQATLESMQARSIVEWRAWESS